MNKRKVIGNILMIPLYLLGIATIGTFAVAIFWAIVNGGPGRWASIGFIVIVGSLLCAVWGQYILIGEQYKEEDETL